MARCRNIFLPNQVQDGANKMMVREGILARDQHFQKLISSLRQVADTIGNFKLIVRAWAVIASSTGESADIMKAREKALESGHRSSRAESLAVLAKTLAKAKRFGEARAIAFDITGLDAYWHAEARIWIARFSGKNTAEEPDIQNAHDAVEAIHTHELRNDARTDMHMLLSLQQKHAVHEHQYFDSLRALLGTLTELKELEDSHTVLPKHTSSFLYHKAMEITNRFFADAMRG